MILSSLPVESRSILTKFINLIHKPEAILTQQIKMEHFENFPYVKLYNLLNSFFIFVLCGMEVVIQRH